MGDPPATALARRPEAAKILFSTFVVVAAGARQTAAVRHCSQGLSERQQFKRKKRASHALLRDKGSSCSSLAFSEFCTICVEFPKRPSRGLAESPQGGVVQGPVVVTCGPWTATMFKEKKFRRGSRIRARMGPSSSMAPARRPANPIWAATRIGLLSCGLQLLKLHAVAGPTHQAAPLVASFCIACLCVTGTCSEAVSCNCVMAGHFTCQTGGEHFVHHTPGQVVHDIYIALKLHTLPSRPCLCKCCFLSYLLSF